MGDLITPSPTAAIVMLVWNVVFVMMLARAVTSSSRSELVIYQTLGLFLLMLLAIPLLLLLMLFPLAVIDWLAFGTAPLLLFLLAKRSARSAY